jgi:hypothetical protein
VRLVGALAVGAAALGVVAFALPAGPLGPRRGALAGAVAGAVAVGALVLGAGFAWIGASFELARVPQQLVFGSLALVASLGASAVASRVRSSLSPSVAHVGLSLVVLGLALGNAVVGERFFAFAAGLGAGVVLAAALVAALARLRTKEPAAAHAAFAVVLGYAAGQWMPLVF